ncbi:MAG TPA: hypothetical protein VFB13_17225 [Reyranella sp.]|jgi:uncharacterized membrane protein YidH (DUF202 family)|nr:hypothetical protein [Reyranella sp.]
MRPLPVIGVVLVVLGVIGLVVANVTFTQHKTVLDAGPIKITQDQEKSVPIPTIAGIVAVVAGLGLIFIGRRT